MDRITAISHRKRPTECNTANMSALIYQPNPILLTKMTIRARPTFHFKAQSISKLERISTQIERLVNEKKEFSARMAEIPMSIY